MASGTPIPVPSADCGDSGLCEQIFRWTGEPWLAESSYYLIVKPARILAIILVAMIVRYLLHRTIRKLVRTTAHGSVPPILRPLRERIPASSNGAPIFPERRRQRAEAIGSVLRSSVSVAVFAIATLMVLSELGANLGPLLASAGIAGVALGFGAQTLVKDLIAGLFMLLEDQYGVGDTVDLGGATGVVESVGLRTTTVRDSNGVLWYIRNGEITRVGNKSQGWALVVVDIPIGFAGVEEATSILRQAAAGMAEDPHYAQDFVQPPQVLGVEQITVDGAVIRSVAKTYADAQERVDRELRRRLTEAIESSGIAARMAMRLSTQPPASPASPVSPASAAPAAAAAPPASAAPAASPPPAASAMPLVPPPRTGDDQTSEATQADQPEAQG